MPLFHPKSPLALTSLLGATLILAPRAFAGSLCSDPGADHDHGGIALRWDACVSDGGLASKTFACDSNLGTETLVASFVLADPMQHVNGAQIYIDVASSSSDVPAWWQLAGGVGCRNALSMSAVPNGSAIACPSPWPASALGATLYQDGYNGPSTKEIRAVVSVPPGDEISLPAGVETFCMRILISHSKTTQCGGCATPVCLALSEIDLNGLDTDPWGNTDRAICGPAFGTDSHLVTWQGAAIASASSHPIPGEVFYWMTTDMVCGAATPARRMVWGSIKALYR